MVKIVKVQVTRMMWRVKLIGDFRVARTAKISRKALMTNYRFSDYIGLGHCLTVVDRGEWVLLWMTLGRWGGLCTS